MVAVEILSPQLSQNATRENFPVQMRYRLYQAKTQHTLTHVPVSVMEKKQRIQKRNKGCFCAAKNPLKNRLVSLTYGSHADSTEAGRLFQPTLEQKAPFSPIPFETYFISAFSLSTYLVLQPGL